MRGVNSPTAVANAGSEAQVASWVSRINSTAWYARSLFDWVACMVMFFLPTNDGHPPERRACRTAGKTRSSSWLGRIPKNLYGLWGVQNARRMPTARPPAARLKRKATVDELSESKTTLPCLHCDCPTMNQMGAGKPAGIFHVRPSREDRGRAPVFHRKFGLKRLGLVENGGGIFAPSTAENGVGLAVGFRIKGSDITGAVAPRTEGELGGLG